MKFRNKNKFTVEDEKFLVEWFFEKKVIDVSKDIKEKIFQAHSHKCLNKYEKVYNNVRSNFFRKYGDINTCNISHTGELRIRLNYWFKGLWK